MLFVTHVIRIYDIQDYISKQVTYFNLHAGHARSIDMTEY